jgi:hypothetical protein
MSTQAVSLKKDLGFEVGVRLIYPMLSRPRKPLPTPGAGKEGFVAHRADRRLLVIFFCPFQCPFARRAHHLWRGSGVGNGSALLLPNGGQAALELFL